MWGRFYHYIATLYEGITVTKLNMGVTGHFERRLGFLLDLNIRIFCGINQKLRS